MSPHNNNTTSFRALLVNSSLRTHLRRQPLANHPNNHVSTTLSTIKMREEQKTRLAGALAALSTSAVIAAHRGGHFGLAPFSHKLALTLTTLSWAPYLHRTSLLSSLPVFLLYPLLAVLSVFAIIPVAYALLENLFMGHRVANAQWYDALWRIYAILGLWVGFAVLNERVLRPWWRTNSERFFKVARENSVAGQARKKTLDKRAAALEAIKARVAVVLKKRKLAERAKEARKAELEKVREALTRAEGVLKRAKGRVEDAKDGEVATAIEDMEATTALVEGTRLRERGLEDEVLRTELDLQDLAAQLGILQQEWTEALQMQNYTTFYR